MPLPYLVVFIGVSLTQLIQGQEIGFEDLFDKRVAIDSYNWIYQFLSIIRQPDGTPLKDSQGRVTSHLSGLYYRTLKLLESRIKPIYVFDGKPPEMKKEVAQSRHDVREEAARAWKEALEKKDYAEAKKQAMRATKITDEIIESSRQLLDALGVPWVQAPGEGEALCSLMTRNGEAFATSSQDYDVLLFGSPRLVRNLSISGRKKRGKDYVMVNPEMVLLNDVLDKLGLTQEQLIMVGILIGTDYNPGGVSGLGPKKALDLVRKKKDFDSVFSGVKWDFTVTPGEIADFFRNPQGADYKIKFSEVNDERVLRLMCDEHEFSQERIENALKKLKESKGNQSSLSRWI